MNKRGIATAVLIAGSLALAGCGSSSAAESEPTPSVTTPPADGGTYATVEELKDAFVAAGGSCPAYEQSNIVTLAAESAECSSEAVLSTYLSSSDITQLIQENKDIAEQYDIEFSSWLVGENWVINAPGAEELHEKLGGTVVSW